VPEISRTVGFSGNWWPAKLNESTSHIINADKYLDNALALGSSIGPEFAAQTRPFNGFRILAPVVSALVENGADESS